jgi:hypothetical protein
MDLTICYACWLFRNNLCDIDNVYHTDFAYHSDVCRSVSMFHTIFLLPSQRTGTHLVSTICLGMLLGLPHLQMAGWWSIYNLPHNSSRWTESSLLCRRAHQTVRCTPDMSDARATSADR